MTDAAGASAPASHRVARNVTIMMLGQVLGMPLAMLVNIFMGRRLGPGDYGQYDLLTTFATLAFLFVDWGQSSILPAPIANDRSLSCRYLGSALLWTGGGSLLAMAAMLSIFGLRRSSAPQSLRFGRCRRLVRRLPQADQTAAVSRERADLGAVSHGRRHRARPESVPA